MDYTKGYQVQKRMEEIIPAGTHTYSKGRDQFPLASPQVIDRASGAYCWDVDGNKFIDWAMGNRVIILGHAYPAVNEAVIKEIGKGVNFTRPSTLEYEVAEYLIDLWPVAEMVKFGKNGSDATSAAMKLSRAYTSRKYIAVCQDHPFYAIHDWFIGTTACNNGIPEEISNLTLKFKYNDIESVKKLFAEHPGQIAALMLEPVKNDEPGDFLKELRDITEKEGTVLIFDENISGIRFDIRGAHHRWGVYPDLAAFGKCISNGFSCAVLAGKRDLMELGGLKHDKRRVFLLSQTHGAESTGLAAVKATLEECQKMNVNEHIWNIGAKLVKEFNKCIQESKLEKYVRVIGFDCNPFIICTNEDGEYWPLLHTLLHQEMMSRSVMMPWISITLSHGEEELNSSINAFHESLSILKQALEANRVGEMLIGEAVKPVFRKYNKCVTSPCGMDNGQNKNLPCCN